MVYRGNPETFTLSGRNAEKCCVSCKFSEFLWMMHGVYIFMLVPVMEHILSLPPDDPVTLLFSHQLEYL